MDRRNDISKGVQPDWVNPVPGSAHLENRVRNRFQLKSVRELSSLSRRSSLSASHLRRSIERRIADAASTRPPGPGHPRHPGAIGLGHKRDGAPRLKWRHQNALVGVGQGLDSVRAQRELMSLLLYHAVVDYTLIGSLKTSNAPISTLTTNSAGKYDFTVKTTSDSIALDTGVDSSLDEMLRQRFMVY
ncbi:uncharacterized protein LOC120291742 [Eucalyptus grandis]|uniref:uncharacterized protein LOC120291742 n=1 Tax=Eucalyptus grandis TaxID=71139 RepID=UPI00192F02F0|nr:uncharacterized protein LOC120291742 [Eucalyptus grandis]